MYVIKHIPEDFAVTEISKVKISSQGKFLYFRLWKRDYTTLAALERIASALNITTDAFSSAGNKDRVAVTAQTCSVKGASRQSIEKLKLKDIAVTFMGYGDEPVHVGELEGNRFRIVVRNIDVMPNVNSRFKNFFGEQRFSDKNAEIGRALVKRDFEHAAKIIAEINPAVEMKKHLEKNDWIGAIRHIPRKVLLLFVHAYQSELWNRAAQKSDAEELPVVGFGSVVEDEITKQILEEENVKPFDFVINQLPEVSAEGAVRDVWVEAQDLKIGPLEDDEAFLGKKKVTLEFFLQAGSYATEFIRQSFG